MAVRTAFLIVPTGSEPVSLPRECLRALRYGRVSASLGTTRPPAYTCRAQAVAYDSFELTSDHIQLAPTVAVDLREGKALAHRVLDPS